MRRDQKEKSQLHPGARGFLGLRVLILELISAGPAPHMFATCLRARRLEHVTGPHLGLQDATRRIKSPKIMLNKMPFLAAQHIKPSVSNVVIELLQHGGLRSKPFKVKEKNVAQFVLAAHRARGRRCIDVYSSLCTRLLFRCKIIRSVQRGRSAATPATSFVVLYVSSKRAYNNKYACTQRRPRGQYIFPAKNTVARGVGCRRPDIKREDSARKAAIFLLPFISSPAQCSFQPLSRGHEHAFVFELPFNTRKVSVRLCACVLPIIECIWQERTCASPARAILVAVGARTPLPATDTRQGAPEPPAGTALTSAPITLSDRNM
ncbi:hypothetical protein EVAR_51059_1 [Eumeta japonica]|uniref:Uncharacterized protein n=1 Tax=Eumeta variegata TaxID=151549 RepID=A0A4C1XWL7_EUMVA|nr:hypothetical protein EVAR_51059_1 [Eumeta japonica]